MKHLFVVASILLVSAAAEAKVATARRTDVLSVNAELVRQRTGKDVHNIGFNQVSRHMRSRGANVRHLRARDLGPQKTKIDAARFGHPRAFTISATMTNSVQTVRHLVKNLLAQGVSSDRIVIGGRAVGPKHARAWGVRYYSQPGPSLDRFLASALQHKQTSLR